MISAATLAERLARAEPPGPPTDARLAAVAIVLRLDTEADVLLMRRAEREGDRWSGQIGLPGGHVDPTDRDPYAAAVRETGEELGLDLARVARLLGRLEPLQARARGERLPLFVVPYVFEQHLPSEPVLGPEAAAAFRLPLGPAMLGELDAPYPYEHGGVLREFPSWRFEEHVVWGMTHRILGSLLDLAFGPRPDAGGSRAR